MIYVFGANGQLGKSLKKVKPLDIEVKFLSSRDLDITDNPQLETFFKSTSKEDFIINCAAYTAVDLAEKERDRAFLVNSDAPRSISILCEKYSVNLIHISTDYIFPGTSTSALDEDSTPDPINVYGESKLLGEDYIRKSGCSYCILRTSWVFSEFGNNFLKTMIKLSKKESLNVVDDQFGSPTYAPDLAEAIYKCIANFDLCRDVVLNYSNSKKCSWFEFSKEIMKLIGSNTQILPIPTRDYPTPAQRPPFSLLNTTRIQTSLDIQIRDWKEALKTCIKELKND